jgi:hypothetical protein
MPSVSRTQSFTICYLGIMLPILTDVNHQFEILTADWLGTDHVNSLSVEPTPGVKFVLIAQKKITHEGDTCPCQSKSTIRRPIVRDPMVWKARAGTHRSWGARGHADGAGLPVAG